MHILNLTTQKISYEFEEDFYIKNNAYLIVSSPNELDKLKPILNIDEITLE